MLEIEEIVDLRLYGKEFQVLLGWLGFDTLDNTRKPLAVIYEDQPKLTQVFLEKMDSALSRQALQTVVQETTMLHLNSFRIYPTTPSLSLGWKPIEKQILVQCIRRYGVGRH